MASIARVPKCKHGMKPETCAICRPPVRAATVIEDPWEETPSIRRHIAPSLRERMPLPVRKMAEPLPAADEKVPEATVEPKPLASKIPQRPTPEEIAEAAGAGPRRYWSQFTPEQRSEINRKRQVEARERRERAGRELGVAAAGEPPAEPEPPAPRFAPPSVAGECRLVVEIGFDLRELAKRSPSDIDEALRHLSAIVIGCRELRRILQAIPTASEPLHG